MAATPRTDAPLVFFAGVGVGVALTVGAVLIWKRQTSASPTLSTTEVIRDDNGRIAAVEQLEGVRVGTGGGVGQTQLVRADE